MAAKVAPNKYLHDIAVQYQVYLERVKQGEVNKFSKALVELDRKLRAVISAQGSGKLSGISQKDFEKLVSAAKKATGDTTGTFAGTLMQDLQHIATYAAKFEADSLSAGLVAQTAVRVAKASAANAWKLAQKTPIQATGELLQPFVQNWKAGVVNRVENVLRNGQAQGKTTGQIIQQLRGTKAANYEDGILSGKTRRETAAMVRTAIQHTSSQGRMATWQENDDIVDGYIWVSTLDSHTTQICRSLDGQEFDLNGGPMPPIHIGCRSVTVARIKDINVLAFTTRASKGAKPGQVPASMTYYEWLKTQPAAFQDDAIGPVRAKLLRDGGMSAEKFAALNLNKNFQPLTLKQMQEKAPGAFKRAGIDQAA